MKLFELLNTCFNVRPGYFSSYPDFSIKLFFTKKIGNFCQDEYILKSDYFDDKFYLEKYRSRLVLTWVIVKLNYLIVYLEGDL